MKNQNSSRKQMARQPKPKRELDNAVTLDFDGNLISPETFRRAVNAFVDLIREVSKEVSGSSTKIQWNISVASGSRLVIARPVPDPATQRKSHEAVAAINSGVRRLEKGTTTNPIFFTENALRAARELASLQDKDSKTVMYVRIRTNGQAAELTQNAVKSTSALMGGQHQALSCIEGKLQTISERGSFQFVVFDDLFDRGVNCFIDEEMMKEALTHFGKRVAVLGMVQYDRDGRPVSIKVQTIKPFPEVQALPPIKSLRGIFKRS